MLQNIGFDHGLNHMGFFGFVELLVFCLCTIYIHRIFTKLHNAISEIGVDTQSNVSSTVGLEETPASVRCRR